jgi:hypothetical protein
MTTGNFAAAIFAPDDLVEIPARAVEVAARHQVVHRILREHHSYRSGEGVQWQPVAEAGVGRCLLVVAHGAAPRRAGFAD